VNAYRDTIRYEELVDAMPLGMGGTLENPADRVVRERRDALINRSGVFNTPAGELRTFEDPHRMTLEMRVRFNSSAWTGL
jgi:hypothetical protein